MNSKRAAVILAAGKSTRMKSSRSKVLHDVGGRSMLAWVKALADAAGVQKTICVVGAANDDVRAAAEALGMDIAIQEPQLGTGHAVLAAYDHLKDFDGVVSVLYADTPLIGVETTKRVFDSLEQADISVLGFEAEDPAAYGRLIVKDGELMSIVEAKDATPEQLNIKLCNSGVISARCKDLFSALQRVGNNNAKGEYYLTDVIEILRSDGHRAVVVTGDENEVLGVNSRKDLAKAEIAFQNRKRQNLLDYGVTLRDPDTVIFAYDTEVGADVEIGAHVVFGPDVQVESGAVIHPFSHLEGCRIEADASVGPFARLKPGTHLGAGGKIGNFVETKNAKIGQGTKINHLSYIGDAEVGAKVNIGAGTITCNYDGYNKHKTQIGTGAFIGTNSVLVAPVEIGKGAFLAAGGVITSNVPPDALALARPEQVNKDGWALRYHVAQSKRKKSKG